MTYEDIADNMLDYFSEDAFHCWTCEKSDAIPVWFEFPANDVWRSPLENRLKKQLSGTYTNTSGTEIGSPLTLAKSIKDALAVISFAEDRRDGDPGLAYSVRFPSGDEIPGWFSLAI